MSEPVDGTAVARELLRHSPFAGLLGLEVLRLEPGAAALAMPFDARLATAGEVVHGGAIGTLIDTAATAAAWSHTFEAFPTRWGTVSMTVNYERPAEGADLVAEASVTRRGRSLCFCEIEVKGDGRVASGTVVYALA